MSFWIKDNPPLLLTDSLVASRWLAPHTGSTQNALLPGSSSGLQRLQALADGPGLRWKAQAKHTSNVAQIGTDSLGLSLAQLSQSLHSASTEIWSADHSHYVFRCPVLQGTGSDTWSVSFTNTIQGQQSFLGLLLPYLIPPVGPRSLVPILPSAGLSALPDITGDTVASDLCSRIVSCFCLPSPSSNPIPAQQLVG